MKQYLDAIRTVMDHGTRKGNRTGIDTISCFNVNYAIDLADGFPLLTTKSISWKNIVIENLWFLSGRTDIGLLQKHGCKFWDAWADPETGEVPSAYGAYWRHFPIHSQKRYEDGHRLQFNDQIAWAVDELKRNPMSRRVVVSAWAPGNAQTSKLPPCHAMFVLNVQNDAAMPYPLMHDGHFTGQDTQRRLCLHLTQRSCDMALGVPYNIAGYAFLLSLFSRFTGIQPGIFAHTLIDAHIYTAKPNGEKAEYDHMPGLQAQLTRTPRKRPKLHIDTSVRSLDDINRLLEKDTATIMEHFVLEGYDPCPPLTFKVAV